MKIYDTVSMALKNLFKRKVRTFLTVLAVMIGSASIIVMFSLGLGLNRSMAQQAEMFGDITIIEVYNGEYVYSGIGQPFDDAMIKEVESLPEVQVVSPMMWISFELASGRYTTTTSFIAIRPEMLIAKDFPILEGRMMEAGEKGVIVASKRLPYTFMTARERKKLESGRGNYYYYGDLEADEAKVDVFKDRLQYTPPKVEGDKKRVRPIELEVVGMMDEGFSYEQSQNYIDFETAVEIQKMQGRQYEDQRRGQKKFKGYEQVQIKCYKMDDVTTVMEHIKGLGFTNVYANAESIQQFQDMIGSLQGFLLFMGVIFLIVAGIMVANTMIMSIYERTREIGVMKVIGASIKDIRNLFLTEAAFIGLFGGVVGVIVSLIITSVLNKVGLPFLDIYVMGEGSEMAVVTPTLAIGGLLFSAFVGLVSGILPARQAMKLEAIEAIEAE